MNAPVETKLQNGLPNLFHAVIARLPWLVLGLALIGTVAAWYMTRAAVLEAAKTGFDSTVSDAISKIQGRMRAYEQVLRGGVALFAAHGAVDRATWLQYVKDLRTEVSYPGMQAIGYAQHVDGVLKDTFLQSIRAGDNILYQIWPHGDRALYTPVVHIAPFEGANAKVLGYDMFSEPIRRAALEQARDSGEAMLSGKVRLVQESAPVRKQAGTLLYLPVYHRGMPHSTPQERRAALQGYVYGAFRMSDLMRNTLDSSNYRKVDIELFDGPEAHPESLLFDGDTRLHSFAKEYATPFVAVRHMAVAGRPWTLSFAARPAFARARFGNTSETSVAATDHSPPTPIATRNRSIATCHKFAAKYVRPEKTE